MTKHVAFGLLVILAVMFSSCRCPDKTDLPRPAPKKIIWSDRVIPLPKEMAVAKSAVRRADEILLEPFASADAQIATAATLIRHFALAQQSGQFIVRMVLASKPGGSIPAGIIERLAKAPNKDQAYTIIPLASPEGVALIGNTPLGVLYAARTFAMLVQAPEKVAADSTLALPLASVLDWPDLELRGIWGENPAAAAWLAGWKMNDMQFDAVCGFNEEGLPYAAVNKEVMGKTAAEGISAVYYIPHLAIMAQGVVKNAKARERYGNALAPAVDHGFLGTSHFFCMQSAGAREIVAKWLMDIADQVAPFHNDLKVWFSEGQAVCTCEKCAGKNAYLLELQCITAAFDKVRAKYPEMRLCLLLSQGTYDYDDSNNKIIENLPAGIRLSYYQGQKTYLTDRNPMVPTNLEAFCKAGGWLDIVPSIGANIRTYVPFSSPQFVHYRMTEFTDKKLKGISLFVPPSVLYYPVNTAAAAEWSWNSKGRTPLQFARAYANVMRLKNTDDFVRWVECIGEPNWDIAEQPAGGTSFLTFFWRDMENSFGIGARFMKPVENGRLWDRAVFSNDMQNAVEALAIAKRLDQPVLEYESEFTVNMLKTCAVLRTITEAQELTAAQMLELGNTLDEAALRYHNALIGWNDLMQKTMRKSTQVETGDSKDDVAASEMAERARNMTVALYLAADAAWKMFAKHGVKDPRPETRIVPLGAWKASDFSKGAAVVKIDITDKVRRTGGLYHATFDSTEGYGTRIGSVEVVEQASAGGEKNLCVSPDTWTGVRGAGRYRRVEHRLFIPQIQDNARIFLVARLNIADKSLWKTFPEGLPEERKVCGGRIGLRKIQEMKGTNENVQ